MKIVPKYGIPIGAGLRLHPKLAFTQLRTGIWFFFLSKDKHPSVDEVIWVWPWKRKIKDNSIWDGASYKWLSILSGGGFNSLKDITEFWQDFDNEMMKNEKNKSCSS